MKQIGIVLSCWFLMSCGNNGDCNNAAFSNKTEKETENIEIAQADAISPVLINELQSIFTDYDSLGVNNNRSKIRIFIGIFSQEDEDCYFTIINSLYYDSSYLKGYVIVRKKMIAFYNPEDACNNGLVDITKLMKDKPDNFPDEESEIAIHTIFDPSGKKYKIHSPDSLELVYTGFF